jgi:hypothetical protein
MAMRRWAAWLCLSPLLVVCASAAQFQTSDRCIACHTGVSFPSAEELPIAADWRTSLMANSSRDLYWQASVRRETLDHASSPSAIEDECSICHMPIARYQARLAGGPGQVFVHLPFKSGNPADREAADGVSCSICHQISPDNLGKPDSFNGGFRVKGPNTAGARVEYGPFAIDPGLQQVMRSSTGGFEPRQGDQIRSAELCATCHTLITRALGPNGQTLGSLPEQVPYQEWLHSDYRNQRTCQSCHMPGVDHDVPIARILGVNRPGVARHEFVAANFFLQRMFSRYHDELSLVAPARELDLAADRTVHYLQTQAARVTISAPELKAGVLRFVVTAGNLGGHKLPTAYPSRRAWLHVTVRNSDGRVAFESGVLNPDGSIEGNDNDADPTRYEPHFREIHSRDQVQIYESILGDANGRVTTGLLSAVGYLKDNRLLPQGFDKTTADAQIAVHGDAREDPAFSDKGDEVRYAIAVDPTLPSCAVTAELWYQPIGFRWAANLKAYDAAEPRRFTDHYDAMSRDSATVLASATSHCN